MQAWDDSRLEQLSIQELRQLSEDIKDAVRAAIRRSREEKSRSPLVASAVTSAPAAAAQSLSLEAERDAWLARKRSDGRS